MAPAQITLYYTQRHDVVFHCCMVVLAISFVVSIWAGTPSLKRALREGRAPRHLLDSFSNLVIRGVGVWTPYLATCGCC
jgi:hypothetical protein